jgi:hypothetical protein
MKVKGKHIAQDMIILVLGHFIAGYIFTNYEPKYIPIVFYIMGIFGGMQILMSYPIELVKRRSLLSFISLDMRKSDDFFSNIGIILSICVLSILMLREINIGAIFMAIVCFILGGSFIITIRFTFRYLFKI